MTDEPFALDESAEESFEVRLDDEPAVTRGPVYVDVVARTHERRPIVPASLRGAANVKATLRHTLGRWAHALGFHAVRAPRYAVLAGWWAVIGVFRLLGRQVRWWWVLEQHQLRQDAAATNDPYTWMKLHTEARATRHTRGLVLAGEVVAVAAAVLVLVYLAPGWAWMIVVAVAVPFLAHVGRPVDRPIVTPAVVTSRFRKLTADIVLRAYYAAGLGSPDKDGQRVTFGSVMSRDGEGSRVLVDLPYGKGFEDAVKARGRIASGLDVAVSQVFLTRDRSSNRRHMLWVADRDPLALPAGRTPLLALRPTDIWVPAPFGLDERGRGVAVELLWNSVLIGAMPRQGKTFSARALALYAALDPHVKLTVFDGKGSPDWRKFALVADRYGFGLALTRDGDPVEAFLDALRELKADVQDRYQRLSELPPEVVPEGKLTREIARDPRYRMPVRLVVIDEFQEYFDLGEASKEIAALLVYLVKVAPGAGVVLLGATQKPSGVGGGQVAQAFTSYRDQHQIRFSLRTGSWNVSETVLGAGAYAEGFDSSTLLPEYKGVGILRGASDATPTVRTYLADGTDAERILVAARALRERAGTLSGMAAGEERVRGTAYNLLEDVREVWQIGEPALWSELIVPRLASLRPEVYGQWTVEMFGAAMAAAGVETVQLGRRIDGKTVNRKGVRFRELEAALAAQGVSASPRERSLRLVSGPGDDAKGIGR